MGASKSSRSGAYYIKALPDFSFSMAAYQFSSHIVKNIPLLFWKKHIVSIFRRSLEKNVSLYNTDPKGINEVILGQ